MSENYWASPPSYEASGDIAIADHQRRQMRFNKSGNDGTISPLGVMECLLATGVYWGAAIHFGSFLYLGCAAMAVPLFLLRTDRSKLLALRVYRVIFVESKDFLASTAFPVDGKYPWWRLLPAIAIMILFPLLIPLLMFLGIFVRVGVTAWCLITHPLEAVSAMASNWVKQSFCTDITVPPEIVPGEGQFEGLSNFSFFGLFRLFRDASQYESIGAQIFIWLIAAILISIAYTPAILLRKVCKTHPVALAPGGRMRDDIGHDSDDVRP